MTTDSERKGIRGTTYPRVDMFNHAPQLPLPALFQGQAKNFWTSLRTFILDTDASDRAIGAVLSQIQSDKEVVLGY